MLTTRLWMGTLLVILATGVVTVDHHLAPVFPFLWLFQTGLVLIGTHRADRSARPRPPAAVADQHRRASLLLNTMNWLPTG